MSAGYEVAHIDELEALPINQGEFVWRPVRRRFGITAFGTNVYSGDAGNRVIEEHRERDGHEEMYVVLRGRATFTLDEDELDAPAGTLVFIRPGTLRTAFAQEDATAILAVGAKPGEVFRPSQWEDVFAGISYAETGDVDKGRAIIREGIEKLPDAWQGYYNLACLEARFGDPDEAVGLLRTALEKGGDDVKGYAEKDSDFDSVRGRPDFPA
jgi:quercetin dioxygenase-like cupin family protein